MYLRFSSAKWIALLWALFLVGCSTTYNDGTTAIETGKPILG
jgi:hypothetical protein